MSLFLFRNWIERGSWSWKRTELGRSRINSDGFFCKTSSSFEICGLRIILWTSLWTSPCVQHKFFQAPLLPKHDCVLTSSRLHVSSILWCPTFPNLSLPLIAEFSGSECWTDPPWPSMTNFLAIWMSGWSRDMGFYSGTSGMWSLLGIRLSSEERRAMSKTTRSEDLKMQRSFLSVTRLSHRMNLFRMQIIHDHICHLLTGWLRSGWSSCQGPISFSPLQCAISEKSEREREHCRLRIEEE